MSDKVVRLREKPKARPERRAAARRGQLSTADVLDALRQRIARQEIPPGSKLREHDLADEFGVPRTRIREVFGALESRGLIERIPNRGAVVTRLDLAQVFQLYDVREVLEGLCVRLATENVPPESWQDLVDHFGGPMATYVREGDFDAFIAGYERSAPAHHRGRAQRGRRRRCSTASTRRPTSSSAASSSCRAAPRSASREHRAVLAAMRRGDAAEAERLKRANLRSAKETLMRFQNYVL